MFRNSSRTINHARGCIRSPVDEKSLHVSDKLNFDFSPSYGLSPDDVITRPPWRRPGLAWDYFAPQRVPQLPQSYDSATTTILD